MRRIQLLLAALAIVVTAFAAFSGSAIANDRDNDWDHNGNVVWHSNNGDWDDWDNYWWLWANDWDDDGWDHGWNNNGWGNNWHHGCEGPVCLID